MTLGVGVRVQGVLGVLQPGLAWAVLCGLWWGILSATQRQLTDVTWFLSVCLYLELPRVSPLFTQLGMRFSVVWAQGAGQIQITED